MIVSNASTLILLAKVTVLRTFLENKRVSIPRIVEEEILVKKELFDAKLIQKAIGDGLIKVKRTDTSTVGEILLDFRMDVGEAATYVLWKKEGGVILADDRELIKLCKIEGIEFLNALAVVVRLFEQKKLTKEAAIEKLKKLKFYGRYAQHVYEYYASQVI
ncbi:MAG: hypothetical protein OXR66_04600 [Candidatus Woesearchaeota archaeon]|nr:hypothetical protein [Candidatus Woesearchaeota archaeon]